MTRPEQLSALPIQMTDLDAAAVERCRRSGFAVDDSERGPTRAEAVVLAGQNSPPVQWLQILLRRYACREAEADEDLVLEARVLLPPLPRAVDALVAQLGPWLAEEDPARIGAADLLTRELLTNAIAHRSYADDALHRRIGLFWFTDGLRVDSPGAPDPRSELREAGFEAAWGRNPVLMSLLAASTGARLQRGVGWRAAHRAARSLGYALEAAAEGDTTVVRVRIDPERYLDRQDGRKETRQRVPVDSWASAVVAELRKGPARARDLRERLGLAPSTLRAVLARLEADGVAAPESENRRSPKQRWLLVQDPG